MTRRNAKKINIRNLVFGGKKIYIQSMLNCRPEDTDGNIKQAINLKEAGCDIIRVAIPDERSIGLIKAIKESVEIPLVADIHFDYKLAIAAAEAGIDKIRINPGNIGSDEKIKMVADICKEKEIPIRIGVNSGSLEKDILQKYGKPSAEALTESAMRNIALLEKFDFTDIVVSIKSSDIETTVNSYRIIAEQCGYPLHLGVTETGTERMGTIKSAIGIGSLLLDGIGDTIRVSLTSDPVDEVYAAKDILKATGLLDGIKFISCPTCGRTRINLIKLAKETEKALENVKKPITVAVMGCAVNGPGEAREADIGIAGGDGCAVLFQKGKVIGSFREEEIVNILLKKIEKI